MDGRFSIRSPQHRRRFGLVLGLSFCLTPLITCAQGINISGVVFSDRGKERISGALVRLCDAGGRVIEEQRTRSQGEFIFSGLMARRGYTIQLSAEGYEPTQYDVTGDRQLTLYLFMKSVEPNSSKPATDSAVSGHELSMPHSARELYASGMKKLYGDKNAQGGLEDFQRALRKAPSFYEAQFQTGMAYLRLGKGAEAEANFRKSIEVSGGKYPDADVALGVLLMDRGELDAASSQFHRALELKPSAWMACYKLGDIAYREENLTDAETWAKKAIEIKPNMPMVYQLLAQIHTKQKNYPAAVQDLDTYLELDPDSLNATHVKELREQLRNLIEK